MPSCPSTCLVQSASSPPGDSPLFGATLLSSALPLHSPSTSFAQSRLTKSRNQLAMTLGSSPDTNSQRFPLDFGGSSCPPPFVAYSPGPHDFKPVPTETGKTFEPRLVLPASPISPTTSPFIPSDDEMQDPYTTPPRPILIAALIKSRLSPGTDAQDLLSSHPLLSIREDNLYGIWPLDTKFDALSNKYPDAPLTPPLTPPFSARVELPRIETVIKKPASFHTSTVSSRALNKYPLHRLFRKQYALQEELGSGGFGFVVRAIRIIDGLSVAVKFIERSKIPKHGWAGSKSWGPGLGLGAKIDGIQNVPMEAYILRSVQLEGVVRYIDLFEDERYFYLIMEHFGSPWRTSEKEDHYTSPSDLPLLVAATKQQSSSSRSSPKPPFAEISPPRPIPMQRRTSCDLFECIEQHSRFSESIARYIFRQVVEAVYALEKMGICHRDLKDENIVVSADYRVKLIDFGSAAIFDPFKAPPFYHRFHGTTSFASAEILRGEAYQATVSEVWSLGVLLSILLTGECPFADASAAAAGRISRTKIRMEPGVERLMRNCLDMNIKTRISVTEIRQHPWVWGNST